MEFFPDRTHVSLWIREYEQYLVAEEDGEGTAICKDRCGLHGAWAVHRLVRDGTDYVLFHSASSGRYLGQIEVKDEGYFDAVQCTYDSPEQEANVLFQARRAEEDDSDDIFISGRLGDWCRLYDEDTPMHELIIPLHWVVDAIPARLPPELPDPPEPIQPPAKPVGRRIHAVLPQAVLRRRINYVRADDQGNFNPLQWRVMPQFEGQSVFNLRRDLADELGEANDDLGITLCAWAGSNGRLTPLVMDLPPDERTMNIVVLTTESPAAQELVYANVDAAP